MNNYSFEKSHNDLHLQLANGIQKIEENSRKIEESNKKAESKLNHINSILDNIDNMWK